MENTVISLIITLLNDRWTIRTPLDLNHDAPRTEYAPPKSPSDLNRGRILERQLQWLCLSTKTLVRCTSACRVKDMVWARLLFSDDWSHAIFLDKRRSNILDAKQCKLEQASQHRERHVEMPFNRHCSSLKVRRTLHLP
jgi:hypothetical protein